VGELGEELSEIVWLTGRVGNAVELDRAAQAAAPGGIVERLPSTGGVGGTVLPVERVPSPGNLAATIATVYNNTVYNNTVCPPPPSLTSKDPEEKAWWDPSGKAPFSPPAVSKISLPTKDGATPFHFPAPQVISSDIGISSGIGIGAAAGTHTQQKVQIY
jgi:hypothetical protein